jgi:hypothetical protein
VRPAPARADRTPCDHESGEGDGFAGGGVGAAGFAGAAGAAVAFESGAAGLGVAAAAGGVAAGGFGFAAGGFGVAAAFGSGFAAPGIGFAAGDAVLVDERGARGSPAFGAPTDAGEPDVPRRAAAFAFGFRADAGFGRAAFARPAVVGGVAVEAGVPGVRGASSAGLSCSPRRRRPASPAPAETASRAVRATESMMSLGLRAMR